MKNIWKIAAVLVIIGIIGAAYGWFFVYNKSHVDYEKAEADFTLKASECYQYYSTTSGSENQYNGKVLEITGQPTAIEKSDSSVIVVFAFSEGLFGDEGIRCTMLPNHNEKSLAINTGETVKIKGFCSGYNETDVILLHCSIID